MSNHNFEVYLSSFKITTSELSSTNQKTTKITHTEHTERFIEKLLLLNDTRPDAGRVEDIKHITFHTTRKDENWLTSPHLPHAHTDIPGGTRTFICDQ